MSSAVLEPLQYDPLKRELRVLDQRRLPREEVYIEVKDIHQGHDVIRNMSVRGAPAIALVAALSLSVDLNSVKSHISSSSELKSLLDSKLEKLSQARPTAVNLMRMCNDIKAVFDEGLHKRLDSNALIESVVKFSEESLREDRETNLKLSEVGADAILDKLIDREEKVCILTHCNTGSLATSFYGTALGVIRKVHERKRLRKAFCTETRPYNQGSRLTAFELVSDQVPGCLICDSAAGALMSKTRIAAVVVGADRVAANGDVANKIGTLNLAILANHHNIPFYVASPVSTLDLNLANGAAIPIEQRSPEEILNCGCPRKETIGAQGIEVWNPAFDVTPANLVTGGIVTELGVLRPPLDSPQNKKILGLS